jgi:hypothetical protein
MVERQVGGDAKQPRFERPTPVPLVGVRPDAQKRLLGHIFRRRVIKHDTTHVSPNRFAVARQQRFKRSRVAGAHKLDQVVI